MGPGAAGVPAGAAAGAVAGVGSGAAAGAATDAATPGATSNGVAVAAAAVGGGGDSTAPPAPALKKIKIRQPEVCDLNHEPAIPLLRKITNLRSPKSFF